MKPYILGFSQPKLVDLGLTNAEVIILDHLKQFFNKGIAKVKQKDGKNYFWITIPELVRQLPLLRIEKERMRQLINNMCKIGVLEKFDSTSTSIYLNIKYNMLSDNVNDDLVQVTGNDTSLAQYVNIEQYEGTQFYNMIRYNAFNYYYETPAIDEDFLKRNLGEFTRALKNNLKLLVSPVIYEMGLKNLTIASAPNTIILIFKNMGLANIERNTFKIETAICGAYVSLLINRYFATDKPAPTKKYKYGQFNNVLLSDTEITQLNAQYGDEKVNKTINELSIYISSKGVKYANHYATIMSFIEKSQTLPEPVTFYSKPSKKPQKRDYSQEELEGLFTKPDDVII